MEKQVLGFYLRLVASLFIIIVGFGVVAPALVSYPDDFIVALGFAVIFIFNPLLLYVLWRDFFK